MKEMGSKYTKIDANPSSWGLGPHVGQFWSTEPDPTCQ